MDKKLADLPKQPGVYFYKDKTGEIIYVGKAAVLKNRVKQYFHPSTMLRARKSDPKTEALVNEIADVDWMVVDSELDALFLEAEMVRRYMPRYNILLRDDKSMVYIRIDYASDYPTVSTTRRPLDDKAIYYGPYLSALSVRQALKVLRRVFPYATRRIGGQKRASLYYHLGLDPGLEEGKTNLKEYRSNLKKLMRVIEGKRKTIERELEKDMKNYSKDQDFEGATKARNQLYALKSLGKQVIFSDKEFLDISKDHALNELVDLLSLAKFPSQIEGYDISHQQGSDVVASMVVFANGASNKSEYRRFKTKQNKNDDFYNMHETLSRRLSERNRKLWGLPDFVLIDGGKGQLEAALRARDEAGIVDIPFVGLAKREEQIVIRKSSKVASSELRVARGSGVGLNLDVVHRLGGYVAESDDFLLVNIPHNTNVVKLLQRIRDESHRFAVNYHSTLKVKRQTASILDDIPGVGPVTRKKLLRAFGSTKNIMAITEQEISQAIGPSLAKKIKQQI